MSAEDPKRPSTPLAPETTPFWQALAEHRLELQRCTNCGKFIHYPRRRCPSCWSADLTWVQVSGRATLRSYTVIHRPGHPAWNANTPYVVALVELEEGPCLLSNIVDEDTQLRPGDELVAQFVHDGDTPLVKFARTAPRGRAPKSRSGS
jgi:uncharacterized OB-fold protein